MHDRGMELSLRALSSSRLVGSFHKLAGMVPVALRTVSNSLLRSPIFVGSSLMCFMTSDTVVRKGIVYVIILDKIQRYALEYDY
ncbi:MAG TPA: hypothetical protein VJQ25_14060 [Nitrospira sp.]|jgi:hypothetical protein|nr:hypothetical protein [Nitrospira sp.]